MLRNERLQLRALEPEDLECLYRWENNTEIWPDGITHSAFSRYALKQYLANSHSDIYEDKGVRYMIELHEGCEPVGCIDLYDFDVHNQKVAFALVLDSAFQGRGIASECVGLILEYAFSFLQLRQVYGYAAEHNVASRTMFERCGFVETACLRQWTKVLDGYADVYLYQKFNDK